jgi:preprotein translocase subunit SecE
MKRNASEMAKVNPMQFIQQVRAETAKISWPSRNETLITTVMVLMMVAASAVFFLGVDAILKYVINLVVFGKSIF